MSDDGEPKPAYPVGYGKPPTSGRFKPGASGNPRGRPKRSAVQIPTTHSLAVSGQPLNQLLLREMARTTTVIEGGKKVRLSRAEVMLKNMMLLGIKSDRPALRFLLDWLNDIQQEDRKDRCTNFEELIKFKTEGERVIAAARKAGLPEPEILPHPDDIIIDLYTPEFRVLGPWTPEQLADAKVRQARLAKLMKSLDELYFLIEQETEEDLKATMWKSAVDLQTQIHAINLALPARLRLL